MPVPSSRKVRWMLVQFQVGSKTLVQLRMCDVVGLRRKWLLAPTRKPGRRNSSTFPTHVCTPTCSVCVGVDFWAMNYSSNQRCGVRCKNADCTPIHLKEKIARGIDFPPKKSNLSFSLSHPGLLVNNQISKLLQSKYKLLVLSDTAIK